MSLEENKALVRRWFEEVMNRGDLRVLDEICMVCAPQAAMIRGVSEQAPKGIEGARALVRAFRTAFPDVYYEIGSRWPRGTGW